MENSASRLKTKIFCEYTQFMDSLKNGSVENAINNAHAIVFKGDSNNRIQANNVRDCFSDEQIAGLLQSKNALDDIYTGKYLFCMRS